MRTRLSTLDENSASWLGLLAEWGLSILVETDDVTILVDTGRSMVAAHNARIMGVKIKSIDKILFSHGHQDHTGGLVDLLKLDDMSEIPDENEGDVGSEARYSYFANSDNHRKQLQTSCFRTDVPFFAVLKGKSGFPVHRIVPKYCLDPSFPVSLLKPFGECLSVWKHFLALLTLFLGGIEQKLLEAALFSPSSRAHLPWILLQSLFAQFLFESDRPSDDLWVRQEQRRQCRLLPLEDER